MNTDIDIKNLPEKNELVYPKTEQATFNFDLVGIDLNPQNIINNATLLANLMVGEWKTILNRSEPMNPMFKLMGISLLKRLVFDRIEVPMSITLQENSLFTTLHLPFGVREMKWNIDGTTNTEHDPDCGNWLGTCQLVNHSFKRLPDASVIPVLKRTRTNPRVGTVNEFRCVLPDKEFSKILYITYKLTPISKTPDLEIIRVLKPNGPS